MIDKWDKSVPSEASPYLQDDKISFFGSTSPSSSEIQLPMVDLFCGAGGFSVGCQWAGFTPVFGIDHFRPAMETWIYNHPKALGCLGDIRKLSPKTVHNMLTEKGIENISLMTGGVPCQGFSIANRKHNDNDERNFLFLEYMKYVKEFQPNCIILENVSGLRYTAGGSFEKNITAAMNDLGYIVQVKLLNAADYGVPQFRTRLLFVGIRSDLPYSNCFEFPKPFFNPNEYRTLYDALSDLPSLAAGQKLENYTSPPKTKYQELMRGVNNSINKTMSSLLYNHEAPKHPRSTVEMIANTKPGEPLYEKFQQKIRLRNDKPSPTQLAGGIRPSFQFGHPDDARGLTTRERARIQSFPDNYKFLGGIVQERVQTGNAVPPLLIYAVAKEIKKLIQGETSWKK
jgi:DNA (cytosine-5)-methyltransferase 1